MRSEHCLQTLLFAFRRSLHNRVAFAPRDGAPRTVGRGGGRGASEDGGERAVGTMLDSCLSLSLMLLQPTGLPLVCGLTGRLFLKLAAIWTV